jgi:hypothetical protein
MNSNEFSAVSATELSQVEGGHKLELLFTFISLGVQIGWALRDAANKVVGFLPEPKPDPWG